jgi:hypothetical protein
LCGTDVENDMLSLHNLLVEYRTLLKNTAEITISPEKDDDEDEDDQKEKLNQDSFLQQEIQMLEEISQELSSLVYERQFEQAIDIMESTMEKIADMKQEILDPKFLASLGKIKREIDATSNKLVENLMTELKVIFYSLRLSF